MPQASKAAATGAAKFLILPLAFAWGFTWIATAIGLKEVPLWTLRFVGTGLGAAAMAQMTGATSRVIIITYSMPIWTAVFSRFMLGERLDFVRRTALALCIAGLAILMWPQLEQGLTPSVFFALGCALSWAFASVYLKWAKVKVAPLANAAWQLLAGTVVITIGMLIFDHYPRLWPIHLSSVLAIVYLGLIGVGLAHFLWWSIIGKLSPLTASIGALLVPVVGVTASTLLLGERPTVPDMIGFALIFAAAACVLLQPSTRTA